MQYDFIDTLNEFDAGVFVAQLSRAVAETALSVMTNGDKGKKGKVTITLDMARVGESSQVQVTHTLSHNKPTRRGKTGEELTTQTVFYVGRGGRLSIVPHNQGNLDFETKKENA